MWGKRTRRILRCCIRRNIPTRVGKTRAVARRSPRPPEHPHACGENSFRFSEGVSAGGTSPRVWGKLLVRREHVARGRNIPTRVGKTRCLLTRSARAPEHPHACGENNRYSPMRSPCHGTSPRVWGKLNESGRKHAVMRNIPTRVGKTREWASICRQAPEHPHACGENALKPSWVSERIGTSPRVWGKLNEALPNVAVTRNIPTRVGKTLPPVQTPTFGAEHPHACGENRRRRRRAPGLLGASPRVWGKLDRIFVVEHLVRSIPTRVGKTRMARIARVLRAEHPHACGENLVARFTYFSMRRNIPTRVGKTPSESGRLSPGAEHPHACGEN